MPRSRGNSKDSLYSFQVDTDDIAGGRIEDGEGKLTFASAFQESPYSGSNTQLCVQPREVVGGLAARSDEDIRCEAKNSSQVRLC